MVKCGEAQHGVVLRHCDLMQMAKSEVGGRKHDGDTLVACVRF
jgi:hypothetical protein